jgi:hypothetical protein
MRLEHVMRARCDRGRMPRPTPGALQYADGRTRAVANAARARRKSLKALEGWLRRLAMEPPFRLLVRAILKRAPVSVSTRALWDISDRPPYLVGVRYAARRALREGVGEISVIEFGVAGGNGLLALEREAEAVEKELGVSIKVYGFDNGPAGLPAFIGDHRDHPDKWKPGDFPMDEPLLRSKLGRRTTLVLGNVEKTVPRFFDDPSVPPVGFVAFDLDLYSSTTYALRVLTMPGRRTLDHVAVYFDDTEHSISHRFAGELLAIDEFNQTNAHVKIDRWRGLRSDRPFPEASFLQKMYMAHDLQAISTRVLDRDSLQRSLSPSSRAGPGPS